MRILKGAFSIVAFSALFANVLGAPVVDTGKIVAYEDGDELARYAKDLGGLNEPLPRMDIPVNARNDEIDIRDKPPTEGDFRTYFKSLEGKTGYRNFPQKLVFWSGVTEKQALDFATANKRFTLGMLIEGNKDWDIFKKPKSEGGYWQNWEQCLAKFWSPISKVIAEFATGDVFAFSSVERHEKQKQPGNCKAIWCTVEKQLLITSLNSKKSPKVKNIKAYVLEKTGKSKLVGLIKKMTD
ncbi:hypothetical protein MY1884_009414 [Beauveria asiatica]